MGQNTSLAPVSNENLSFIMKKSKLQSPPGFIPDDHPVQMIDLSGNEICFFPQTLLNLTSLNLSDNNLVEFFNKNPSMEFHFPLLQTLRLSDNGFEFLPDCILKQSQLKHLYVDRNKLSCIDTGKLPLESLDLTINMFNEIPSLPASLVSLNMGFNNIRSLSCSLQNLVELRLAGNEINEIGADLNFPNLKYLDLSFNRIFLFPPITAIAPNLETLLLSFNILDEFPIHLPLCITKLDLSHNCINKWEDPIMHLESLIYLDISYNLITEVPELPSSMEIFIPHHNRIKKVHPLDQNLLKTVFFTENCLANFPDVSSSFLENLNLNRNSIESIKLPCLNEYLKKIEISTGYIGEIPTDFCLFINIQHLDLSGNHICRLPDDIKNMQLRHLLLNENPICTLPELPLTLHTLSCCKCQFNDIPDSIYSIPHISRIDFSCNRIKSVSTLPEIPYIILSCNQISQIPILPNSITSLQIAHNKLKKFVLEKDYPLLLEIDISHNQVNQCILRPLIGLKILKISFNPLELEIDLSQFPSLDSIDLCETSIKFIDSPPPPKMREISYSDFEWFSKSTSAQYKLFECSNAGYSETIGLRPSMEDSLVIRSNMSPALYAVIDGHGGFRTSSLSAYLIPVYFSQLEQKATSGASEVLKKLNDRLRKMGVKDGATLVMTLVSQSQIGCAHVGDARALIVRKDGTVVQLTSDHKATDRTEFDLVKENRAFLSSGRLMGTLAVSRAVGDFGIDGVMRVPSLTSYSIKDGDMRLVLACDGVFDVMTNEEIGRNVAENRDVHLAAAIVRNLAFARGSQDNLSVIVVDIER